MSSAPVPEVVDRPEQQRFVVDADGAEAELLYRFDDGKMFLVHTGVPDELGGRGIGGRLVQAAASRAEREHLTVVPWCPFARRWLEDHPDQTARLTVDWAARPPDSTRLSSRRRTPPGGVPPRRRG